MAVIPIALLRSGLGALFLAFITYTGAIVKAQEEVIRIGYQKSGALLLLKNEGTLEKRLAPLGYSVEWREFPSGPPLLEALNAGKSTTSCTRSVWAGALVTMNRDSATTLGSLGAAESRFAWARTAVSILAAAITVTQSATPVI